MNEEGNIYQMGLVPIIGEFNLVATPSLIKVQVIKKKLVEQMPETPLKILADHGDDVFRVLGRVGPHVVFHSDSQQFSKIHRNDFVDYTASTLHKMAPESEKGNIKGIQQKALMKFNSIPQMFEG